jgi:transcriptional regulator with XRE-family HTH domain
MKDARLKPRRPEALSARELLARWLVRGRMTQAEAAEQIGLSRVQLNQYLQGEKRPSLEMAIRIEDATGISIRSWLSEDALETPRVTDGDTGERAADGAVRLTE